MTHMPLLHSPTDCSGTSDPVVVLSCRRFAGQVGLLLIMSACLTGKRYPEMSGSEEALPFICCTLPNRKILTVPEAC